MTIVAAAHRDLYVSIIPILLSRWEDMTGIIISTTPNTPVGVDRKMQQVGTRVAPIMSSSKENLAMPVPNTMAKLSN